MTIESITKFRTDDGQEFDSEAEAIAHEKFVSLKKVVDEYTVFSNEGFFEFIREYSDLILEYLAGEDLPQPHPAPTFGYRDGDSIEPVHPILFRGEVIRQPEDAWNACRQYAVEIVGEKYKNSSSPASRHTIQWVRHTLNSKLTLDEGINDAETPS